MPEISEKELTRMKQSLEELTTLNRIANAINVSMSIDKITKTIVDHCCKRVQAEQGAIFLIEKDTPDEDQFKTFIRETSKDEGQIPFHLNLSLQGWMVKNRSILLSNDPDTDDRIRGSNYKKLGLKNILASPLLSQRGILGVLVLFNKIDEGGFTDRDKRFSGIVSAQVSKVIENAQLHEREHLLNEIEKEMDVAKTIQEGFLPKENITSDTIETFGFNIPAKSVGGDYFDLIQLNENKLFFSLGDVSGKGLPAALLTGNAQAVMRSQLHGDETPDLPAVADCLNQLIYHFTSSEQYITAIFGIIDSKNNKLSYINAGHLAPVIVRSNGNIETPSESDLVIGVLPDVQFKTLELEFNQSDSVYLYTDGITEAENESQEQFGDDRLLEALTGTNGKEIEVVCRDIENTLTKYRGTASQSDDITVLALKIK